MDVCIEVPVDVRMSGEMPGAMGWMGEKNGWMDKKIEKVLDGLIDAEMDR